MAFKDYFIKSDEPKQNVADTNQQHSQPTSQISQQVSSPIQVTPSQTVTSSISSNKDIVDTIWTHIIEKNRPGPDYLELRNNIEALADLPVSPEQRIISAFKVLKKSYPNFQKEDITKAIDYYKKVVEDEKASGLAELDQLRKANVDGAEQELVSMQQQAEALKNQYDELMQSIATKSTELLQAKNDIEQKTQSFNSSVDEVMNVLNNDAEQISRINF